MATPIFGSDNRDRDVVRVTQELAARLRARGIVMEDSDSPDEVVAIAEGVEEFERAVEAQGGDLMVDEPPGDRSGEPDDAHFLLPRRNADEPVATYLERLHAATVAARDHRPHG